MACGQYWDSPFQVGGKSLAKAFAELGFAVFYLSAPISPLHFLTPRRSGVVARWRDHRRGPHKVFSATGSIVAWTPFALLTPAKRLFLETEFCGRTWLSTTIPRLPQKLAHAGFGSPDLLYIDCPLFAELPDRIRAKKTILRIADDSFPHLPRCYDALERTSAKKADITFYTAMELKPRAESLGGKRVELLPNGVDLQHFSAETLAYPLPLPGATYNRILYVGAIEYWFNWGLLIEVARQMPDLEFIVAGPVRAKPSAQLPGNITAIGAVPYKNVPALMRAAAVGIIPFDVVRYPDLVNRVNPLKMYEYLASGLPVVSTKWRELERLDAPIRLATDISQFCQELRAAVAEVADNRSAEKRAMFVRQCDWKARATQVLEKVAGL